MINKLKYIFHRGSYRKVLQKSSLLFVFHDKSNIEQYQIDKFNEVWEDAYKNIPFFKEWKDTYKLPSSISSLSELSNWPVLTKKDILEEIKNVKRDVPPTGKVITSGSTGVPLNLPVWHDEETQSNMWIGRAANGILPDDKTFLIWGHHHLYGTGLTRIKNIIIRSVKDIILGYKRISAYDTSEPAMMAALKKYEKFKPAFVIGYSSSVLSFVRCNKKVGVKNLPKLVLCTAGPLSDKEKEEIRDFFSCPLCMEYGSVECGVMAYTVNDCNCYKTFWMSHLLQGKKDSNGKIRNIVTKLSKNYFPLIRYDIGDYLDVPEGESLDSILNINTILGRPTDIVTLDNGVSFFAMLIEACVEHLEGLISHQLLVKGNSLEILLVALRHLDENDFNSVLKKLQAVVPNLNNCDIVIKQVDELNKNKGGKTPLVIRL